MRGGKEQVEANFRLPENLDATLLSQLFNIFALFTRDFEQLRWFPMNGTPESMNLQSVENSTSPRPLLSPSLPGLSATQRGLTKERAKMKWLEQVKNVDQNTFPS